MRLRHSNKRGKIKPSQDYKQGRKHHKVLNSRQESK